MGKKAAVRAVLCVLLLALSGCTQVAVPAETERMTYEVGTGQIVTL